MKISDIYKPPFTYEYGYIFDSFGKMVSDEESVDCSKVMRIRGWSHLQQEKDPAELQDAIGHRIAKILSEHWAEPDECIDIEDLEVEAIYQGECPFFEFGQWDGLAFVGACTLFGNLKMRSEFHISQPLGTFRPVKKIGSKAFRCSDIFCVTQTQDRNKCTACGRESGVK